MVKPSDLESLCANKNDPKHRKTIYVVNINSEDVIVPRDDKEKFDKVDYYKSP